jgi:hypothetical protein
MLGRPVGGQAIGPENQIAIAMIKLKEGSTKAASIRYYLKIEMKRSDPSRSIAPKP